MNCQHAVSKAKAGLLAVALVLSACGKVPFNIEECIQNQIHRLSESRKLVDSELYKEIVATCKELNGVK